MALADKVIVVTGGTSGIGAACSRHFAALGARVVIASNQVEAGQAVMGVNVRGNFLLLKHIVPVMERQGQGVIVITTSVAAFVGFPAHALYCASKAALEALIRCLAVDHAGVIRVGG